MYFLSVSAEYYCSKYSSSKFNSYACTGPGQQVVPTNLICRCQCSPQLVGPPKARPIWPSPSMTQPAPRHAWDSPPCQPCQGLGCHPSPWAGPARHGVSLPSRWWPANSNGRVKPAQPTQPAKACSLQDVIPDTPLPKS